jgi:hypothetical protein
MNWKRQKWEEILTEISFRSFLDIMSSAKRA